MYEVKIYMTGKFEIYNINRKKIVFAGIDKTIIGKGGQSYKFKNVENLMSSFSTWVSLATYKKISKVLCAW